MSERATMPGPQDHPVGHAILKLPIAITLILGLVGCIGPTTDGPIDFSISVEAQCTGPKSFEAFGEWWATDERPGVDAGEYPGQLSRRGDTATFESVVGWQVKFRRVSVRPIAIACSIDEVDDTVPEASDDAGGSVSLTSIVGSLVGAIGIVFVVHLSRRRCDQCKTLWVMEKSGREKFRVGVFDSTTKDQWQCTRCGATKWMGRGDGGGGGGGDGG